MLSKSEVSDYIKSIEVFSAGFFSVKLSIMANGVVVLQDKLSVLDRVAKLFVSKEWYKLFLNALVMKVLEYSFIE